MKKNPGRKYREAMVPEIDGHIREVLRRHPVIDIGGGTPWETGWVHEVYGGLLKEKKAICLDYNFSKKPHIVADVHCLPFGTGSIGGIICNAVLEHVSNPFLAAAEIHRVLKPGGAAFVYVPFLYPYHDEVDYWRFTENAIRHLFRQFSEIEVVPAKEGYAGVFLSFLVFHVEPFKGMALHLRGIMDWLLTAFGFGAYLLIKGRKARPSDFRRKMRSYLHDRNVHGHFILLKK
ncbi:MAG: class I SAM-dependent methyltransferase [Nitrospiraceae bacterium]|nr:class I SAM-dependent methyltransferase [Nitrospiraceae bacterium]